MASIASQVIFHPAVSQGLKYGGTTLGRDKVSFSYLVPYSYVQINDYNRLTELSNTLLDSMRGI